MSFVWYRVTEDIVPDTTSTELVQGPSATVSEIAPMVDLTAEDPPQVEATGSTGIDAAMLQDAIKSLEDLTAPAPKNVDTAPPPEDVTALTTTTTNEKAIVVAESVVPFEKEGTVLDEVVSRGASKAGASFTQKLVFAPVQKTGASEVVGSPKIGVVESPLAELLPESEIQGMIASVQVCLWC